MRDWNSQKTSLAERLAAGHPHASGKMVALADLQAFLEAVLRPGDRVCLEGDNQKQADLLARALAAADYNRFRRPSCWRAFPPINAAWPWQCSPWAWWSRRCWVPRSVAT